MADFIENREVMLAPTHRTDPVLNFEHWDMKRIQDYIDMLHAFGFNSLQLAEVRAYPSPYEEAALEDLGKKINAMAEYAKTRGMRTSFFLWAQILFDPRKVFCPSKPSDRRAMEKEYERMARAYGSHFDHIIAYWGEPGPCMERCGRCDYQTYESMTAVLLETFRKCNPEIRATFNIWGLLRRERAGRIADSTWEILDRRSYRFLERMVAYKEIMERLELGGPIVNDEKRIEAISKLSVSTTLPKEIGICLDGCTTGALTWSGPEPLHFDEIEIIARSGRPVGVWGWYLTDLEGSQRSDFEIRRVGDYFESIPKRIGELIDWHSVEITSHGWPPIIVNVYVAGQKMRNPRKPLEEILGEFCEAYFGDKVAPAMRDCLMVLDAAPLVSRVLPKVEIVNLLGTKQYEREAKKCLETLKGVKPRLGFGPSFPAIIEPQELRSFVIERLKRTIALSKRLRDFHTGKIL